MRRFTVLAVLLCVAGATSCNEDDTSTVNATGTTLNASFPVQAVNLKSGVNLMDVGTHHGCAIKENNQLFCWGMNRYGETGVEVTEGSLGRVDTIPELRHTFDGTVSALAMGSRLSCALVSGAVYCWGKNDKGQLGNGTTTNTHTPTAVTTLTSGVTAIGAGYDHVCALKDGGAWCWGWNDRGQVGNGSETETFTEPQQVSDMTTGVTALAVAGNHTCALKSDVMTCWGSNNNSQIGKDIDRVTTSNGEESFSRTPTNPTGMDSGVTLIAANHLKTCAMKSGALYCWGDNEALLMGVAGKKLYIEAPTPTVMGVPTTITQLAIGGNHTCYVESTGAVKCWGSNSTGQVGDLTQISKIGPVQVEGLDSGVTYLGLGVSHSCALIGDNVKCWGAGTFGQLGHF